MCLLSVLLPLSTFQCTAWKICSSIKWFHSYLHCTLIFQELYWSAYLSSILGSLLAFPLSHSFYIHFNLSQHFGACKFLDNAYFMYKQLFLPPVKIFFTEGIVLRCVCFFLNVCCRHIFKTAWRTPTKFSHKVEGWKDGSHPIENGCDRFNWFAAILEKHGFSALGSLILASYV